MQKKLTVVCVCTFVGALYMSNANVVCAAQLTNKGVAKTSMDDYNKEQAKLFKSQKASTKSLKAPDELEIEYLHPMNFTDRHIDTYSVHILESVGNIHHTDVYRGFTVTRATGSLTKDNIERDSDALGVGYTYLFRKKKNIGKKIALAFDASGGLVFYDKAFPATGRAYNFMWRVGPRVIYMPTSRTSFSLGWTYMHVSNGLRSHNPGYNSGGVTLGFGWDF